jgi:hypothetical protein
MMSALRSALITKSRAVHPWRAAGASDDVELLGEFHIITPAPSRMAPSAVSVNSPPAMDLDRIRGQRFRMRVDAAHAGSGLVYYSSGVTLKASKSDLCFCADRGDHRTCASDRLCFCSPCSAYSLRSMPSPLLDTAIATVLSSVLTARDLRGTDATGGAPLLRTASSVSILARPMGELAAVAPDTSSTISTRWNAEGQMHCSICNGKR